MRREDLELWAEAYDKEYQGFVHHGTVKVARPPPGAKILGALGTTARTEYKVVNGAFQKRKVRLCAMGNQQKEGIHFKKTAMYAPVMKATEERTFIAIAAKNGQRVSRSDTKEAFSNGKIRTEVLCMRPPNWRPEMVQEGHALH